MAAIQKVQNKNGSTSYRAIIRKTGLKPITKTFNTKRLAIQFAQRIEGSQDLAESLGNPATSNLTLRKIVDEFLKQYAKKDPMIKNRLWWWSDHYGHLTVNEIDPVTIKAGLRKLSANGRNSPTLNRYKAALSSVFIYAMDEYDLTSNPCLKVKSKPENKGRVRYLTECERKVLLTACRESKWKKLYLIVLMALTTGARRGELLGLTWLILILTIA